MVDLDDGLTLAQGGSSFAGGLVNGGGVCTGQDGASLRIETSSIAVVVINNCRSQPPSQAIPQRIYIPTMESIA
jgi:hypothetical protein